jgi:4a-hydroxytetrahydrobiopterin dehydratase
MEGIMQRLDTQSIHQRLENLPGWSFHQDAIHKSYSFPSFHRAIAFVVQIGMLADAADHHPDIDVRYNRVEVTLSTHSAGGVTEKDLALAARIEEAQER